MTVKLLLRILKLCSVLKITVTPTFNLKIKINDIEYKVQFKIHQVWLIKTSLYFEISKKSTSENLCKRLILKQTTIYLLFNDLSLAEQNI